ncbi:gamma-glutamyl-gamma-aminobutyraldehyde dehydrogenase [Escherichia coli]|nr:gamma-glutamyl-gamma-aminobutyraldehyde dehydrogenase [Escherichia coli]
MRFVSRGWRKKQACGWCVERGDGFGHEAGQALSRHNDIDAIAFTGSTRTGKQLLKDAGDSNMKRVWLEAGGKSANIVFADCPDLQQAASATAAGISTTRDRCASPERACSGREHRR